MPVVQISMLEGRTKDQKRALVAKVTDAVVTTVGSNPENVRVIVHEIPKENFAFGGKTAEDLGR